MKTSELSGNQLDWAVAKAQGYKEIKIFARHRHTDRGWIEVRFNPEPKAATASYYPSEDWGFGGPIIDREKIGFVMRFEPEHGDDTRWMAIYYKGGTSNHYGPTQLIAAMRCYVASKLGDEVEVPKELL